MLPDSERTSLHRPITELSDVVGSACGWRNQCLDAESLLS